MKLKHNLVGAGLIVALSIGATAVPAASTATSDRTTASYTASGAISGAGASAPANTRPVDSSAGTPVTTSNQQAGVLARAFIAAVKKWGASAYNAMVKAIKRGYNSFTKWLGTVPGWVKSAAGALGTSALYDWLKSILGL